MAQDKLALKMSLRDRMLELEATELSTAQEHHERFIEEAKLDGREQHDTSDMAEARENADLAAAFDHPVKDHHAKIDVLENLDFSVTEHVRPGAVVGFGGQFVVVSVSTARFDHEGATYMGISPQSPIYKAMDDLEAGQSFVLNGKAITIEDVF